MAPSSVPRPLASLCLIATTGCGGARSATTPPAPGPTPIAAPDRGLDRCLSVERAPIDLVAVQDTWWALARGEQPPPLHVRRWSADGECVDSWWQPVEPLAACGVEEPTRRSFLMRDVGTLVVDVPTQKFWLLPADEEYFDVDGHEVNRTAKLTAIQTAHGGVAVPGFPEHVIDDHHAIIADPAGDGMLVYDLDREQTVMSVVPRKGTTAAVAGTAVVRDPAARRGARVIGGVVFGGTWEGFAIDGAGKLLASVTAPSGRVALPVVSPEGVMVLAAYRDGAIEVQEVTGRGKPVTRVVPFDAGEVDRLLAPNVAAGGDTVVVGFETRAAILRPDAEPILVEGGRGLFVKLWVLAGGNVVVVVTDGDRGTFVIDARTGAELARVSDHEPKLTLGAGSVIVVDDQAAADATAVVVTADGAVRRGPVDKVTVGRYELLSFAGVPDPSRACDARALMVLPALVQYDTWILPDALVVD